MLTSASPPPNRGTQLPGLRDMFREWRKDGIRGKELPVTQACHMPQPTHGKAERRKRGTARQLTGNINLHGKAEHCSVDFCKCQRQGGETENPEHSFLLDVIDICSRRRITPD